MEVTLRIETDTVEVIGAYDENKDIYVIVEIAYGEMDIQKYDMNDKNLIYGIGLIYDEYSKIDGVKIYIDEELLQLIEEVI